MTKLSNYKKHNFYVNGNTVSISRNSLKDFNDFSVTNVYIYIYIYQVRYRNIYM